MLSRLATAGYSLIIVVEKLSLFARSVCIVSRAFDRWIIRVSMGNLFRERTILTIVSRVEGNFNRNSPVAFSVNTICYIRWIKFCVLLDIWRTYRSEIFLLFLFKIILGTIPRN